MVTRPEVRTTAPTEKMAKLSMNMVSSSRSRIASRLPSRPRGSSALQSLSAVGPLRSDEQGFTRAKVPRYLVSTRHERRGKMGREGEVEKEFAGGDCGGERVAAVGVFEHYVPRLRHPESTPAAGQTTVATPFWSNSMLPILRTSAMGPMLIGCRVMEWSAGYLLRPVRSISHSISWLSGGHRTS